MKIFLIILMVAVWQDLQFRSIGKYFLWLSGGLGLGFSIYCGRPLSQILLSVGIGVCLLGCSYVTKGGIGEGDGWFFIVSGLFLNPEANLALLLSGLLFCSIYSLMLTAMVFVGNGNIKKIRLPFLPFLVPFGLWMVFL